MTQLPQEPMNLRSVITWTVGVCVAVAMAPWLSGGQEPLAMLLSVGAVLLGALLLWRQPAVRRLRRGSLVWAWSAFIGWGALSLWWTANHYSTIIWLITFGLAGLIFRLSYSMAGEPQGRQRLVGLYLASAVAFAVYGVWLYLTSDYDRLTGSFYWANPAAAYLIPAILLSVDGVGKRGPVRWWWLAGLAGFGTAFAMTDSRAATIVLGLVVVVYLLVHTLSKTQWITLLFGFIAIVGLSFGSVQLRHVVQPNAATIAPGSRFAEAASGESKSASDRLRYLESALNMWFHQPLQGVGAGAYGDVHPQYQLRVVSAATSAHNFYVQTLAELGLVGAVVLAWVLLILLLGIFRGLLAGARFGVPLALGLLGLLLHMGLDIDAHYPALVVLAAAIAGFLYTQREEARAGLGWRLPLLAAVLLAPTISLYQSAVWAQRAQASQGNGDYATAGNQYAQAHSQLVYNPDVISAEGIDLYAQGLISAPGSRDFLAEALDRARQAEREDPHDAQHHQLEGRVLRAQGDAAGAERAFRAALKLDPYNHPDYAGDLANLLAAEGRTNEAISVIQTMLSQYPDDVIANRSTDRSVRPLVANLWALRGNIALKANDLTLARRCVGRALTIDPQNLQGRALKHQVDLRS